jgi:hypothetical protein
MPDYQFGSGTLYYSDGTAAVTNGNLVWNTWVSTGTTSTSVSDTVWTTWQNGTTYRVNYIPVQMTPEEQAAHDERMAVQRAEWDERERIRKEEEAEAKRKARVLLEEILSDEQRKQLADNAWFEVVTPKGTYRIRTGWSGNVDRYVDGKLNDRYCIHPSEYVPNEDNMLAQKLLLEADEEAFLRIANRSTPHA